jgi:chromate transporter
VKELAFVFLKLGTVAFGGPAAHIAMMEDEVVRRRSWMTHEHFLDLLGATNLIPGPNSTEMALHIGHTRAGWKGLVVAGACFILPAVFIALLLARLYVDFGTIPQLRPFISGIHSAIIAVVLVAVFRLSKPLLKTRLMTVVGTTVFLLNLVGIDEILLLLTAGGIGLLWNYRDQLRQTTLSFFGSFPLLKMPALGAIIIGGIIVNGPTVTGLGFFFLKIGSVLYGSGYVLVAYLQGGLVDTRHWLTQPQLLDAIAVGQFTPGPVLSTATFIGYLILGVPGATVATIGIFLPSFVFVLATRPFISKLRRSTLASGFLDGVNAASIGLMLAVTMMLAASTLTSLASWTMFIIAAVVVMVWKLNAAWIVLGSAVLGWLFSFL